MAQQHSIESRFAQAAIIGDSDAAPGTLDVARQVGAMLASHSITVITGGRGGVMEAASRAAVEHGGCTVGILPSAALDDASRWCRIVIPTGLGHARNVITSLAADMVIAVGGGAGTLSELCFAWIHGRPIYLMKGSGGWSDRLPDGSLDHRSTSTIVRCRNLAALERHVIALCQSSGLRCTESPS